MISNGLFKNACRVALLFALVIAVPLASEAQTRPMQRMMRTYIPPDQLVSFLPSTPFDQFIEFLNPIFKRVTGKEVIDPGETATPIGISVAGMHFADALEVVLGYNGLTFRETDRFFIVEPAPAVEAIISSSNVPAQPATTTRNVSAQEPAASLDTREIRINAILFDLNQSMVRDSGIDWNVLFGEQQSSSSGGSSSEEGGQPRFFLKTDRIFKDNDFIKGPKELEFKTLTQLFRALETEGYGTTIASPQVTVQSGQKGEIQVGSDIPFNTRDYAGNTVIQFLKTGVIIEVTPTLITEAIADTAGSPMIDFVHLNVNVDKSTGRPSLSGPTIDRNKATTQVILLPGEQTVIGGLYSTDEGVTRRGVPILKDLPWWFFGLRYVFGYTQKTTAQKELLIVLQAELLDRLELRANRPFEDDSLERARRQVRQALGRVDPKLEKEGPRSSK